MANRAIFREAALERLSTPARLDAGLTVVGSAGWALIAGLVLLIVGGLAWSCLLVVPVTVRGEGILLNPGGVLEVTSGSQGRVLKFHAEIGDVAAGHKAGRCNETEITLFKSVGNAVQDAAIAARVLERADVLGLGMEARM